MASNRKRGQRISRSRASAHRSTAASRRKRPTKRSRPRTSTSGRTRARTSGASGGIAGASRYRNGLLRGYINPHR